MGAKITYWISRLICLKRLVPVRAGDQLELVSYNPNASSDHVFKGR